MKNFKYDVIKLIESVRDRPCLWNKKLEVYKDRVERRLAWDEILNLLDDGYETMSPEQKRLTHEVVQTKWANIRDTFIKTLKQRAGRTKKQYMLYDHLRFLLERGDLTIPIDQDNLGYSDQNNMKDEDQMEFHHNYSNHLTNFEVSFESEASASAAEEITEPVRITRKRLKRERVSEEPNIDFVSVDPNDPRIMNEDEAFFASLLPTVVKYTEDERLEFRIEVLSVMKKIKDKRKWPSDSV